MIIFSADFLFLLRRFSLFYMRRRQQMRVYFFSDAAFSMPPRCFSPCYAVLSIA